MSVLRNKSREARPAPPILYSVKVVSTDEYLNQEPGRLGLFQPKSEYSRKRFTENYIQSVFDAFVATGTKVSGSTFVIGGDGSALATRVARIVLRIAAGNGVSHVVVGVDARFSAPALSGVIRDVGAAGGFYLAGDAGRLSRENEEVDEEEDEEEEEFGVQAFDATGGLTSDDFNKVLFKKTRYITKFHECTDFAASVFNYPSTSATYVDGRNFVYEIIDPIEGFVARLKGVFDFDYIAEWARRYPRRVVFGVGGGVLEMYVRRVFVQELGMGEECLVRVKGWRKREGEVGDVAEIVAAMKRFPADFGVSLSPDGRRHALICSEGHVINPSDAFALVAAHAHLVPGLPRRVGFARSVTTSRAVDAVAAKRRVECHVTPPGWRHVGALLDGGRACLFGNIAFETGSNHVRTPDGIWAALATMTAVAKAENGEADWVEEEEEQEEEEKEEKKKEGEEAGEEKAEGKPIPISEVPSESGPPPVPERLPNPLRAMLQRLWDEFGRYYSVRLDYQGCPPGGVLKMMEHLQIFMRNPLFVSAWYHYGPHSYQVVGAEEFQYTDPVELTFNSSTRCFRVFLHDGSIIIFRCCTAEDEGCGVRVCLDKFESSDFKIKFSRKVSLEPLVEIAKEISKVEAWTLKDGPNARV